MGVEPLDWFVNREKQYEGFLKMARGETRKRIMAVQAPSDLGKTWLIQKLRRACSEHSLPYALIDFRDRRPYDFLYLVRQMRDQLGAAHFNALTDTINRYTSVNITLSTGQPAKSSISVGNLSDVADSQVQVAGGSIIQDNQFFVQADSPVARQAIESHVTDAFFECLAALAQTRRPVFLFDSLEEMPEEAARWIWDQLLGRVQQERLPAALVILAGRKLPEFGAEWGAHIAATGLATFTEEQVAEYIVERRKLGGLDVPTVFKTSGGMPGLLSKMADVAAMATQFEDGWL